MKRFLLLCKRQLLQPVFLILCLALPVCCLLIQKLEQDSDAALCIGLFADTADELTSACFSELTANHGSLTFRIYSEEETMKQDVAANALDCAYTFDNELRTHLLEKNYKNRIVCYTSSSTIMDDLSREVVFAALFRHFGKDIVLTYTDETDLFAAPQESKALRRIAALYDDYLTGEEVFSLQYQYLNQVSSEELSVEELNSEELTSDESPSAVTMPVRGLIAVLLFISGLTGGVTYLNDREKKLPVSATCSIVIPLLFMAASSLFTLWLTNEAGNLLSELSILALYMTSIVIFVRLLLVIIKRPVWLSASIPVFTLGSLLFCPIFFNLGAILPFFKIMEKLFLPYYYLLLS